MAFVPAQIGEEEDVALIECEIATDEGVDAFERFGSPGSVDCRGVSPVART